MTYWDEWRIGNAKWHRTKGLDPTDEPHDPPLSRHATVFGFMAWGIWILAITAVFK